MKHIPIGKGDELQTFHQIPGHREQFGVVPPAGGEIVNIQRVPAHEPVLLQRGNVGLQNGNEKTGFLEALFHIILIDFVPGSKGGVQLHGNTFDDFIDQLNTPFKASYNISFRMDGAKVFTSCSEIVSMNRPFTQLAFRVFPKAGT